MKIIKSTKAKSPLEKLVELQLKARNLPSLSHIEKAKLDQSLALDQLYYSTKVEGSNLTKEMIDRAIHGKEFSAA